MAIPKIAIQADLARQALRPLGRGISVSPGPVVGRQGLQIYVAPGQRPRALRLLGDAGVRVPVNVQERSSSRLQYPYLPNPGVLGSLASRLGIGRRGSTRDIHPPPNPNPAHLDPDIRRFWDRVYRQAFDYYKSANAPDPAKVAARTAWRAVRLDYRERLKPAWLEGHPVPFLERTEQILPDPEDTITLGKLLEYSWLDAEGNLVVRRWPQHPPDLHWNPYTKCLFSFPTLPDSTSCEPITPDLKPLADEFERWSQRKAECANTLMPEAVPIFVVGAGDGAAYRSDKWKLKNSDPSLAGSGEFFHQFSDGVWIWQDQDDDQPNAIMICGGRLDVEERGIIH